MDLFGEFQLKKNHRKCQNGDPHFWENLQKMGVSQKRLIFHFPEFFTKKRLFSQKYIPRGCKFWKWRHEWKNSVRDSLSKMVKNDQKWPFLTFDPHFLQNHSS